MFVLLGFSRASLVCVNSFEQLRMSKSINHCLEVARCVVIPVPGTMRNLICGTLRVTSSILPSDAHQGLA